jgi:glutaredoxin
MGICKFTGKSNTYHDAPEEDPETYNLNYDLKKAVVVVFIEDGCKKCGKALELMSAVNIRPAIIYIAGTENQKGLKKALKQATGTTSTPFVFVNGSYFGGLSEVEKGVKTQSLQKMINSRLESIGSKFT